MSDTSSWDPTGEILSDLQDAVTRYGTGVLSDEDQLKRFFSDRPTRSHEGARLLYLAASDDVDIAGRLQRHVRDGLGLDEALKLSASAFEAAYPTLSSPGSGAWVAAQSARALGYPGLSGYAPPAAAPPNPPSDAPTLLPGAQPAAPTLLANLTPTTPVPAPKRSRWPLVGAGAAVIAVIVILAVPNTPKPATTATAQLASSYSITYDDVTENGHSTGSLTGITEDQEGDISGQMTVDPPLFGNGAFSGKVSSTTVDFTVTVAVPYPCRAGTCSSGTYTGTVGTQGTMSGTYTVYVESGAIAANGTWQASPSP
jgi:hypothetical protein